MTMDLALITDPGELDRLADPGAFVLLSCERAKEWLSNCIAHGEIEQIVELKSQLEAIRVYTATKQLGRDAELAAQEIIRRAERGIGVCIRKGQETGEILRRGQVHHHGNQWTGGDSTERTNSNRRSPLDYVTPGPERAGVYAVTDDVTDEQFEEAITQAKAEGNLSRANVVRKVKGTPAPKPPDRHEMHYRARRINVERIINETIAMLEGIASGLALIEDVSSLDADQRLEWLEALTKPLAAINHFKKELAR
jgi:hypothetical protein